MPGWRIVVFVSEQCLWYCVAGVFSGAVVVGGVLEGRGEGTCPQLPSEQTKNYLQWSPSDRDVVEVVG